jgi:hypothetical protein
MVVRRIVKFVTSDGQEWDDETYAEGHQAFIDITQFFRDGAGDTGCSDEIALLVWKHRDRIKDILSRAHPMTDTEKLSAE